MKNEIINYVCANCGLTTKENQFLRSQGICIECFIDKSSIFKNFNNEHYADMKMTEGRGEQLSKEDIDKIEYFKGDE